MFITRSSITDALHTISAYLSNIMGLFHAIFGTIQQPEIQRKTPFFYMMKENTLGGKTNEQHMSLIPGKKIQKID